MELDIIHAIISDNNVNTTAYDYITFDAILLSMSVQRRMYVRRGCVYIAPGASPSEVLYGGQSVQKLFVS